MAEYQSYSYDVLVIGAGGAGLRAAIEAAASGVKVGVVCKSLLGKAHTVMAEGGVAAALANVDDRDNWRVHFADTMQEDNTSTIGAWPSCTPKRLLIVFASWKPGAHCSIALRTAEFSSATSAAIDTHVLRTSEIALAWR